MRSGVIPIIDLREVFRQAAQSAIVTSAHAVLQGSFPVLARDAPYVQVCCMRPVMLPCHMLLPAKIWPP